MKQKFTSIARGILSIGLMVLFIWLAFRGRDINQLWDALTDVSWLWFVGLFLGGLGSHILRAWRWKYLLYPIKKDVSMRNAFSALMIGYMINGIFPRLGEIVRPYAIKKLEGISGSTALGTVVLERILDIITFAMIVSTVMFLYSDAFVTWFPGIASYKWLFMIGSVFFVFVFVLVFLKADFIFSSLKKMSRILPKKLHSQADRIFGSFLSGFQAAKDPGNFFMIALTSILIWVSYIVLLYLPFYAFGLDTLNFGSAAVLQVASGLAFAIPTPNGIGSYHIFVAFTLTQIFGINSNIALSYAIYTHAVGFLSTLIVGLYYMLRDKIHLSEVTKE
jgi:glycosyltransferase 2 family protein